MSFRMAISRSTCTEREKNTLVKPTQWEDLPHYSEHRNSRCDVDHIPQLTVMERDMKPAQTHVSYLLYSHGGCFQPDTCSLTQICFSGRRQLMEQVLVLTPACLDECHRVERRGERQLLIIKSFVFYLC